jgi:hypothetical protein
MSYHVRTYEARLRRAAIAHWFRGAAIIGLLAAFCFVWWVGFATLAGAGDYTAEAPPTTAGDEAAFVAAINEVRAGVGLPALTVNSQLVTLARSHAQVMADAGEIFHADPISAGFTGSWTKLGENVGVGASVPVLVDAFVASPGHYANIIDPGFTQVGVGVVWKDGALYTTHRFLQPPGYDSEQSHPGYWGEDCDKTEQALQGPRWYADRDYRLVVLKSGTTTNDVFYNVLAGDSVSTVSGKDISHVIRCGGTTPTTTTEAPPTTTVQPPTTTVPTCRRFPSARRTRTAGTARRWATSSAVTL